MQHGNEFAPTNTFVIEFVLRIQLRVVGQPSAAAWVWPVSPMQQGAWVLLTQAPTFLTNIES